MIALTLFASLVVSWIAYSIGWRSGYEAGREHELDRAAKRVTRMKRFYEHNN